MSPGSTASTVDVGRRDPAYLAKVLPLLKVAMRGWFRSEVTGMERVPEGGALMVSNHSGGLLAMDVPIIAVAFADEFGVERPLHVLAHDLLFTASGDPLFRRLGFLPADRENADALLRSGSVTIVFPGGDYDVFRPTSRAATVDFDGRTGYVRTAIRAGVPIVPVVSHGGQEAQLFLSRGEAIGRLLRLDKVLRSPLFPISFGFPFGLTGALPVNLPLPTKIRTTVLDPIHPGDVGEDPAEIDALVRTRMQEELDRLASERRFPVLG